eukprot:scaffold3803_cov105-Skeletonema_marinoi.AAC.1
MRARQEPNGYGDATPRGVPHSTNVSIGEGHVPSEDPQSGEWHYPASERGGEITWNKCGAPVVVGAIYGLNLARSMHGIDEVAGDEA